MNECIYGCTIEHAIEYGALVDVSHTATKAGFQCQVVITHTVWDECIAVSEGDVGQDEKGRLWDLLNSLRLAMRSAGDKQVILFEALIAEGEIRSRPCTLEAHFGPGDDLEPVITVMLHED